MFKTKLKFLQNSVSYKAFLRLKHIFCLKLVFTSFNLNLKLVIKTNASEKAIKTRLFQEKKPVAYYSRKLTLEETNYTINDKKILGIIVFLETLANVYLKSYEKNFS